MANKDIQIDFDPDEFLSGMIEYSEHVEQGLLMGLGQAGARLLRDAIIETPTVPIRDSSLRGSGSWFVEGELKGTSREQSRYPGMPTPARKQNQLTGFGSALLSKFKNILSPSKREYTAVVGFNTPYAAKWHETPANFTEPSSGTKYLENKLSRNRKKYIKIVVSEIRKAVESG